MAKIAIAGRGAMGSVYAALTVDARPRGSCRELWPGHAKAIVTNGLRCEGERRMLAG
jgi:2-dehydropantoate 2-reductase